MDKFRQSYFIADLPGYNGSIEGVILMQKGRGPFLPKKGASYQQYNIGLPVFNCCYDVPDSFAGNYGMEQEDDEVEDVLSCWGNPEGIFCYICRFRKECEMNSRRAAC